MDQRDECRPLTVADSAQLGPLHVRIWRETYSGLMSQEALDALDGEAWTRMWHAMLSDPEGSSVWGAFVAPEETTSTELPESDLAEGAVGTTSELIGWICVGESGDDSAPSSLELKVLNVVAEHQGSGVAHELLRRALGDEAAHLWVVEGNARAIAFYRRHGFEFDGASRLEPEGNHDLRMVRSAPGRLGTP